ncbi:MAG: hypothetical protein AABW79_04590 [Nanoarchaeota archaeon]
MSEKINKITNLYYSNPKVVKAILSFSKNREVVPRYGEGFGKRPDMLSYENDITNLVARGATSFHGSEELWSDPLKLTTEMTPDEMSELRSGWDLLIDIDSPYIDYSKIALKLVIEFLELNKVFSYGIKFSGNKGFHIIVPSSAFPEIHLGQEVRKTFPEWPRALVEYITHSIKPKYNRLVSETGVNFEALQRKTNLAKSDLFEAKCPSCGSRSIEKQSVRFECNRCNTPYERPDYQPTKRKLKCTDPTCPGFFEEIERKKYYYCENCKTSSFNKTQDITNPQKIIYEKGSNQSAKFEEEFDANKLGSLDLVLVSPRHLFRMPYSLHEKTALASIVIKKEEIDKFSPRDADPLKVIIRDFYPVAEENEALFLLNAALAYYKEKKQFEEKSYQKKSEYTQSADFSGVSEKDFPPAIKKLLQGLTDGRKRGLFILLTFLRCLEFPEDYIVAKIYEWNKKNKIPLKEGYIKSQIDWNFRQKRKILPPNYSNASFYKDLNLLDKEPQTKNPIVDVLRKLRHMQKN